MANLSDASVTIEAYKVGKELIDYINATNKSLTDYVIVYDGYSVEQKDEDTIEIHGNSSGRWAYSNNLEGYFDEEHVKNWLGVDANYTWVQDENKKKEYAEQSNMQYEAYQKLMQAIKERDGRIDVTYTDCDPAMDWMGNGVAEISVYQGDLGFTQSFEEESLSISAFADMQGESEYWALEYLHGDEAAEAYSKYLNECKDSGAEPASVDTWYDEIYEQE